MTLRVFFDLTVDEEPLGRIVFRVSSFSLSVCVPARSINIAHAALYLHFVGVAFFIMQLRPDIVPLTSGEWCHCLGLFRRKS